MADLARDSGICVDNDNDSLSSATSSNQCSYVQRLRKRFECLAKEQELEFHSECNWWLEEQAEDDEVTSTVEVHNRILHRDISKESEARIYSKQTSIKSQVSHDSGEKFTVTPATPVKFPDTPEEFPEVTNDSDSFEEDSVVDEEEFLRPLSGISRLSRPLSITSQTSK